MPKTNKLQDYNKELAKVRKEHNRLPLYAARIVTQDHLKISKKKRD